MWTYWETMLRSKHETRGDNMKCWPIFRNMFFIIWSVDDRVSTTFEDTVIESNFIQHKRKDTCVTWGSLIAYLITFICCPTLDLNKNRGKSPILWRQNFMDPIFVKTVHLLDHSDTEREGRKSSILCLLFDFRCR